MAGALPPPLITSPRVREACLSAPDIMYNELQPKIVMSTAGSFSVRFEKPSARSTSPAPYYPAERRHNWQLAAKQRAKSEALPGASSPRNPYLPQPPASPTGCAHCHQQARTIEALRGENARLVKLVGTIHEHVSKFAESSAEQADGTRYLMELLAASTASRSRSRSGSPASRHV